MIVPPSATTSPAQVIASLTVDGAPVHPTERWTQTWTVATGALTTAPTIYGLYAREIPLKKWLTFGVRDLLEHYPGDVGTGSLPRGLAPFRVPGTEMQGLGSWLLLYVGQSTSTGTPRVRQYFGIGSKFTRQPGGQSLHLTLALLFGGEVDPRMVLEPKARTIEDVLRGSLSLTLEHRMREMRLSYVQALTPACTCVGAHSNDCRCYNCSELTMLRSRADEGHAPSSGWPVGARPLINSAW